MKWDIVYHHDWGFTYLHWNVWKGCTSVITAPAQEQALLGRFESRNDLLYLRQLCFHQLHLISLDQTSMAVSGSAIAKTKVRPGFPHTFCFPQGMNWRVLAILGSRKAVILQGTCSKVAPVFPSCGYSATLQRSWVLLLREGKGAVGREHSE